MTTIYGETTNHWRCYIDTWSSEYDISVSAGLTVGIQSCGESFQIPTGIVGHASVGDVDSENNTSFNTPTGSWDKKDITSASKIFVKKHSAYNVTLSGWVQNKSGYMNGKSSASQTITIPALAHYYISFDANGGTGAPDRVDNWYGESLEIPTTIPTRTNYEFLGWSLTKDGSAVYEAGGVYSGVGGDLTVYAVWKFRYNPPWFIRALAIRTSSMTSTINNPLGGYCYASFTYQVDTTLYSDNVATSVVCKYYKDGSPTGVTVTPIGDLNKAYGTANVHFQLDVNSYCYVECIVTDAKSGTAQVARSVTTGTVLIEVANQGKSVGILNTAPSSAGLQLGNSNNPSFRVIAGVPNDQYTPMVEILGEATDLHSNLELSAYVAGNRGNNDEIRGIINLNADDIYLNGGLMAPRQWMLYEKPFGSSETYTPSKLREWYTNNGIFTNCEGPSSDGLFELLDISSQKASIRLFPGMWKIFYAATGKSDDRFLCGIFDNLGTELVSAAANCHGNVLTTAVCEYALTVDNEPINIRVCNSIQGNTGYVRLGRQNTYLILTYVGPVMH